MNAFRYAIAVMLTAAIPAALLYWLLVHPFARFWRRLGARNSYLVICPVVFAVMAGMVRWRGGLLAVDFGLSIPLALVGIVLLVGSGLLLLTLRRQLTVKVLVGVPELSEGTTGSLLTTGIYSRLRHPRYVQMTLAILGYAFIANYPGAYSAVLVWLAGIYAVVLLEERELLDRFGDAYLTYCRRVPRFLPTNWGRR